MHTWMVGLVLLRACGIKKYFKKDTFPFSSFLSPVILLVHDFTRTFNSYLYNITAAFGVAPEGKLCAREHAHARVSQLTLESSVFFYFKKKSI